MDENEDELRALLGVQFEGLENAEKYAAALREANRAQAMLASSTKRANEAMAEAKNLRDQSFAAMPGATNNFGMAANSPRSQKGADASSPGPAFPGRGSAQRESLVRSAISKHVHGDEILAKRSGGAAAQMEKLALSAKALGGRFLLVVEGLAATYGTAYAMARAGSRVQDEYIRSKATSGGTVEEVARMGLMGGTAEKARAFQERITSDPTAMGMAGRLGIHNLKGIYGQKDWTKQYLKAIEQTSAITNRALRRDMELSLGIEQEVAQYILLSTATKRRIRESAEFSAKISDSRLEKEAAEFGASMQMQKQAMDNLSAALGHLVSDDVTGLTNEMAKIVNDTAKKIKDAKDWADKVIPNRHYDTPLGALTFGMMGDPGKDASEGAPDDGIRWARQDLHKYFKTWAGAMAKGWIPGDPGTDTNEDMSRVNLRQFRPKDLQHAQGAKRDSPMMANTLALQGNTEAMNRLNSTIGGGQYTREAMPSPLVGQQLHEARISRQLFISTLG